MKGELEPLEEQHIQTVGILFACRLYYTLTCMQTYKKEGTVKDINFHMLTHTTNQMHTLPLPWLVISV